MRAPASVPAVAVLAGAALGTAVGAGRSQLPAACVFGAGLVTLAAAFAWRRSALFVAALLPVFAAGEYLLAVRADADARQPPLRRLLDRALDKGPTWLEGLLRDDGAAGENGVSVTVDVERCKPPPGWVAAAGGVRLTVGGTQGPGRMGEWTAGRRIRVPALLRLPGRYQDPGVPDGRLALARRGIALVGSVKSAALVEVRDRGSAAAEFAAGVRAFARRAVSEHVGRFAAQSAAIVVAILIGDRAGLDDEVQRRLQEAGTYHVIAISGGNIAILTGFLLYLARLVRIGRRAACWWTMAVVTAYAGLVGGGASVVRATIMAVVWLMGRQADHRVSSVNAVAVAAAFLMVASPSSVADVGCWLTFGATLGILVGAGLAGPWLPRHAWLRAPASLLLTSLSAECALFPVSALVFSRVTFAGLVLNFAAIPLMAVAQFAGMFVLPLSLVWTRAADAAGWAAHLGALGLVASAGLVERAPWSSYRLPPPHVAAVVAYYAAWGAWLVVRRWPEAFGAWRTSAARVAMAWVVASGVWILVEPVSLVVPGVSGRLRVTVLDVGHGDAVLVQLPDRRSLLVDAGGTMSGGGYDIGGRVVAPAVWALGTRRLEAFVLTHPDPDHVGGAAAVVRDFHPRAVWEGVPVEKVEALTRLKAQALAAGIPVEARRAGEVIRLGEVTVRVWNPPPPDWERQRVRNDDSIVLELEYGDVSLVLPGDAGRDVERGLLQSFHPVGLRVLKAPHHGSSTASSAAFVEALSPRVVAVSAGTTTKIGEEVLRRYAEVGADVFRTDRDGAISLDTDGRSLVVSTFTGRKAVFTRYTTTNTASTAPERRR